MLVNCWGLLSPNGPFGTFQGGIEFLDDWHDLQQDVDSHQRHALIPILPSLGPEDLLVAAVTAVEDGPGGDEHLPDLLL